VAHHGISREAHALAAVFVWAIAYWVTEALPAPATALLASVLSPPQCARAGSTSA